jgi:hypothetical protein
MFTTRQEAIARGEVHYNTGKPCSKGHVEGRYTLSGTCVACTRDAVEKNREKVLERRRAIRAGDPRGAR